MPLVPMVIESDGRYERSFDIYSRLLRERIVFLGTEVTDDSANVIAAQLLFLEAEDPERDISLYINSPGGSAYAGMAIYDTMQYVKPDVSTVCVGMAMSAGAMILCGGRSRQALRVAEREGDDPPGLRWLPRHAGGHPDRGAGDPRHDRPDGDDHCAPLGRDKRASAEGHRPRPLLLARGGCRVRARRRRDVRTRRRRGGLSRAKSG